MVLADLDAQIDEAHANNAHLFSVFFDMENAFLRVWTFRICTTFHKICLRGHRPLLIQDYLQYHSFRVRVLNVFSTPQPHENGIHMARWNLIKFYLLSCNPESAADFRIYHHFSWSLFSGGWVDVWAIFGCQFYNNSDRWLKTLTLFLNIILFLIVFI